MISFPWVRSLGLEFKTYFKNGRAKTRIGWIFRKILCRKAHQFSLVHFLTPMFPVNLRIPRLNLVRLGLVLHWDHLADEILLSVAVTSVTLGGSVGSISIARNSRTNRNEKDQNWREKRHSFPALNLPIENRLELRFHVTFLLLRCWKLLLRLCSRQEQSKIVHAC